MSDQKQRTKQREQIDRGETAEIVLKELERSFDAMKKQCFDTFVKSEVDDDYGRLSCWHHMKVLENTRSRFEREIVTGKNARRQLTNLKPKLQTVKSSGRA